MFVRSRRHSRVRESVENLAKLLEKQQPRLWAFRTFAPHCERCRPTAYGLRRGVRAATTRVPRADGRVLERTYSGQGCWTDGVVTSGGRHGRRGAGGSEGKGFSRV